MSQTQATSCPIEPSKPMRGLRAYQAGDAAMADRLEPDCAAGKEPRPTPQDAPRTVCSDDLLRGEKEVWILHHGETYRLRCTRQGKLILCK